MDYFIIVPLTVFLFWEPFWEAEFGSPLRNMQPSLGATEGGRRLRRPPPSVEPIEDCLFHSRDANSASNKGSRNKKTVIGTIIALVGRVR